MYILNTIRQTAITIIDLIDEYHYLKKENKRLNEELKQYKEMIYRDVSRPHPAEAILTLMQEGNLTLHQKKVD